MKSIVVARVSTDEQKENSPDAQLFRMEKYCQSRGFNIMERVSFVESAYKEKRDEFDKIIETIDSQTEKIAVCFDKVDRLSRNIFDKRVALLYEKAINNEIELHFVSDGQVIDDKMNAGDKFSFGIKLGLSKYYSDAISDNVKRAFEQKRRNGEWTGPVKIGYLNVSLDEIHRLRKDIIIDPKKGFLVKKIFEMYSMGNYSYQTIRDEITKLGLISKNGNKLSISIIENIIKDSFYHGVAVSKKYGSYTHKYPRLITKDLFDKCQETRLKRQKMPSKETSTDYIFKGLLRCQNCGCSMSPEMKKGKYVYYSCTNAKGICKREYVNEEILLKPIHEVLSKFETITEEVQNDLVYELRKNTEAEVEFHKNQLNRIRNEYENIKEKDNRLLEAFLDKNIDKDLYDKKHVEFADKLNLLEIELSEHRDADYEYQTTVATVVSLARRAKDIFENCSEPIQKRAFLRMLLQNPVVSGKKLEFTMVSPFNLVLELADSPNWLPRQDSNLRPIA